MCNKWTSCLLMKWEATVERWGWIDGWTDRLLIVEVCSYIRAAWGHSNRSLALIYPPAEPSVHRHLSESINAIWLPASQQLCDRKSMCIMWHILHVHVCMRAPYMSIHRSAHDTFFFFTLAQAFYLDSFVVCHQPLFELCPGGFILRRLR